MNNRDGEVDVSRRQLGAFLGMLGGGAGLSALAACVGRPETGLAGLSPEAIGQTAQALTGGLMMWADTIVPAVSSDGGVATTGPGSGSNLRSLVGSDTSGVSQPVAVVGGYASPNDGGGGIFYWSNDTSPVDDGGTKIIPTKANGTGCWKRVFSGPISVAWFGANPNASASQNVTGINNAITAAGRIFTSVFVPGGTYQINAPITITGYCGLVFEGAGPSNAGTSQPGTKLQWAPGGLASVPMFDLLNCNSCVFRDFNIMTTTTPLAEAFRIHEMSGLGAPSGANKFENLTIAGAGKLGIAFRITNLAHDLDGGADFDGNNDFHVIEDCYATGYTFAAVSVESTEAFGQTIVSCQFDGAGVGKYAVYLVPGGSVNVSGGRVASHTEADFCLVPQSACSISEVYSEGSNRFLENGNDSGVSGTAFPISVTGCFMDALKLNADRNIIRFRSSGAFSVTNCLIGEGATATAPARISVASGYPNNGLEPYYNGTYSFVCTGNTFDWPGSGAQTPFELSSGAMAQIHIAGNLYLDGIYWPWPMAIVPDGSKTPNVFSGEIFYTANTKPTSITNFVSSSAVELAGLGGGGWPGQKITIVVGDSNTIFAGGRMIALAGGAQAWQAPKGSTISFVFDCTTVGQPVWRETSRTVATEGYGY